MYAYIMFAGVEVFTPAVQKCGEEMRISHEAADTPYDRNVWLIDGDIDEDE